MLQKVRESMKGTFVATIVFLFFIVPLILTGVDGGSFLGSAVGTDAASVEGKAISNAELRRAIYMRKQRLLDQQGVDPNAEYLKDENLRGPVLESLTRRAALIVSAEKGGMGVSEQALDQQIRERPEFQLDGKFDAQTYRRLLSNLAFTPASYKAALSEDIILGQHAQAIELSTFSTEEELNDLVSLIHQKRSFFTIKVPKTLVEKDVKVSDDEINTYYEENKNTFVEDESLSVSYVELSAANIAQTIDIDPEVVKQQYEAELADFKKTQEYEIAHILLEEKDGQQALVDEVSQKIKDGDDFAELVSKYSDDSGSKDSGGNLGVMIADTFPEAFENAVYSLEEGQVSAPVVTEAGTHFIKVIAKKVTEPPTFDERKDAIADAMKLAEAEEIYAQNLDRLGELTFSAADLADAAKELNLEVKTTEPFSRNRGTDIAINSNVRDAAYSEEVLSNGYNSSVLEISNTASVVLRKAVHKPERIKGLDEVKEVVTQNLTNKKIDEALSEISSNLKDKLVAGDSAEQLAKADEYEYKAFDKSERSSIEAGFQAVNKAFSMSLAEGSASYDHVVDRDGGHIVLGLTEIIPGHRSDMKDQQFQGLTAQLNGQNANFETSSYESQVVAEADIDIH